MVWDLPILTQLTIAAGTVVVAVVAFLGYRLNKARHQREQAMAANEAENPATLPSGQPCINRMVHKLVAEVQGKTELQIKDINRRYVGSPMQVCGSVEDVSLWHDGKYNVSIEAADVDMLMMGVWAIFDLPEQHEWQVRSLSVGDRIAVAGVIDEIASYHVTLASCEILSE